MTGVDHMTTIQRLCGDIADSGDELAYQRTQAIVEHAAALHAQLEASDARVKRLQLAYLDVEDDFADIGLDHHNACNPHAPLTRDEFKRDCRQYLHDGDLPADEVVS